MQPRTKEAELYDISWMVENKDAELKKQKGCMFWIVSDAWWSIHGAMDAFSMNLLTLSDQT